VAPRGEAGSDGAAGRSGAAPNVTESRDAMSALGRFLIIKKAAPMAALKTLDLRNMLVTGPDLHAGVQNPHLDEDIQPLALTEGEIDDLGAALFPGARAVSIKASARQPCSPPANTRVLSHECVVTSRGRPAELKPHLEA
jgi:hypothetical protein